PLAALDRSLGGLLGELWERGVFEGKKGQCELLHLPRPLRGVRGSPGGRPPGVPVRAARAVLAGLGKEEDLTPEALRRAAGLAAKAARGDGARTLSAELPSGLPPARAAQSVAEGVALALYRMDEYKTRDRKELAAKRVDALTLAAGSRSVDRLRAGPLREGLRRGRVLAEATSYARNLVSEPSNAKTPILLANEARRMARRAGLRCRVLGPKELGRLKMGAFLAVAKGSDEPPRFVILEHRPRGAGGTPLVLVGKGITFDTGGISLKPSQNLEQMKADMSGAAAVLGAMRAIGELKPPRRVVGLVAATENMPSGHATRPGDIARSMAGITVEILNTDAEGRLVLADALQYAKRYRPAAVINLATLTGACAVALADVVSGMFGNHDELMERVRRAGELTGDRVWQLPLYGEYYDMIKGDLGDIRNIGTSRYGGASTAAAFLGNFTKDYPWVHLDIAGTAWGEKNKPYTPKGATGVGVRLLAELVLDWKSLPAQKGRAVGN
ncbi:MAG: leucyl aminopeptidase, partial [Nitrospinota bacterium]